MYCYILERKHNRYRRIPIGNITISSHFILRNS